MNLGGEFFERVAAFEDDADDRRTERELVLAGGVEERFQLVGESLDGQEMES